MAKKKAALIELDVDFKGVSIGQDTARVSFNVTRDRLSIDDAENYFCGRRLVATAKLRSGDANGQTHLLKDMAPVSIKAAFDTRKFSVAPEVIGSGLTCLLTEIDVGDFSHLAGREGKLVIESVEDIPEEEKPAKKAKDEDDE